MDDDLFFDDFDEEDDEDDLFEDYGGEDDPFAALDEAFADDPFRELEATPEHEGYVDAPEPPPAPAQPVEPVVEDDDTPAWLRELGVGEDEFGYIEPEEQPAPPPEPAPTAPRGPVAAVTGTGPEGVAFGLTARQRMLLALFLFLDVSVVACGLLYALGAINFNF